MPLTPGQKLGPYEIIEQAGAGGMGEVFKAKDTRLDRTVAIKTLPATVAANADLKQRFEREAKTISSLNHPNICTLYDIGSEEGIDYIVMEYIEGETLSDRIKRGPIAIDEVLRLAGQIADALDKAHGQGLIHRDLKPSNVMLTSTGAKLLDFGLAKLQITDGHVEGAATITQTTPLTGTGTILGTLQYMSPEQLEGKEVDARSDIFAFGALLYEMSTGKRAFEGGSQASLIARILEREPISVSSINPMTPPAFERLVKKCLNKDPESRWQSARDLADELRWISQSSSSAIGLPAAISHRRKQRSRLAWAGFALAGLIAATFAFLWFTRPIPEDPVTRFNVTTSTNLSEVTWPRLSPDGKNIAFLANNEQGQQMIWIRPMNSLDAYPLAGTEGAGRPFWSPDSKYLGFISGRKQMKKISVSGGPAQIICDSQGGSDGSWGHANLIIYDGGGGDSIRMVPASGGTPIGVTKIDREKGETGNAWPWFLPDGKHFLYLAGRSTQGANYMLKVGDVESDDVVELFPVDARVEYSKQGYIVFFKDNILQARKFNPESLELAGENIPITDKIGVGEANRAEFGLSETGTLTYQTSSTEASDQLVWINRNGEKIGTIGEPASIEDIFLSPDETKLAMAISDGNQADAWIYDLNRNVSTRVTFTEKYDISPCWDISGNYFFFSTDGGDGVYNVYKKAANGMGEKELIFENDSLHTSINSVSNDGEWGYGSIGFTQWDLQRINLHDPSKSEIIVNTPYVEGGGRISPDGKYLAYHSNESGTFEVYVLQLGPGGGRWQVSAGGGRRAEWSKDGTELYYVDPDWNFYAVPVTLGKTFTIGQPKRLFNQRLVTAGWGDHRYCPTSSKDKFIMNIPMERTGGGEFVVVLNWYKDVESR